MSLAPIVLFVYNRPVHTLMTLKSLKENELADQSELFIYCDGPSLKNSDKDNEAIKEVRRVIRSDNWCAKVNFIEIEQNRGLAKSIIHGVSEIVRKFKKIIVLEDDMVTSKYFLRFMNDALKVYENDDQVVSVTGYLFPVKKIMPETFFLRGTYCWGWATWERGWSLFSDDSKFLLEQMEKNNLTNEFDFYGTHHYTRMLKDQVEGKSDSWALPWYAATFLKNKLTLLPGKSLIQNIGLDATGTHGDSTNNWNVALSSVAISVNRIPAIENTKDRKAIADFFKSLLPRRFSKNNLKRKFISLGKRLIGNKSK